MPRNLQQSAEAAYIAAHKDCLDLADQVISLLGDMPSPGDQPAIHYGHVGTIEEVRRRLQAVVAFMSGTEK